ncbi:MAG: phage tail protein I [Sphingomonadaceae bacterium]
MSRDLLPPQSTEMERVMADLIGQYLTPPPPDYVSFWNPDTCPLALLPHLAWAYSVDIWDDEWSEDEQRAVVREAIFVHRHKGTVGAVRAALDALGIGLDITEWWQDGSAPYTFRIDTYADNIFEAGLGINPRLLALISAQIDHIKPVRAHYSLRVGERFPSGISVQAAMTDSFIDRSRPDFSAARDEMYSGVSVQASLRECALDRQDFNFLEAA